MPRHHRCEVGGWCFEMGVILPPSSRPTPAAFRSANHQSAPRPPTCPPARLSQGWHLPHIDSTSPLCVVFDLLRCFVTASNTTYRCEPYAFNAQASHASSKHPAMNSPSHQDSLIRSPSRQVVKSKWPSQGRGGKVKGGSGKGGGEGLEREEGRDCERSRKNFRTCELICKTQDPLRHANIVCNGSH